MATNGMLTLYFGEDERLIDRVTRFAINKLRFLEVHSYWTIEKTVSRKIVGVFLGVSGFAPIVKLFEFLTGERFGKRFAKLEQDGEEIIISRREP